MKRIWFAVVFLAFAAALCVFEQTSLQSACREAAAAADSIEQLAQAGDFGAAEQVCASAQAAWDKHYARLSMLINHQVLDDEKTNFRILRDTLQNGDGEEAAEAVRETRAGAQLVLESVRVSPANVF